MFSECLTKFVDVLIEKEIGKKEDRDLIVYGLMSGFKLLLNIITTIVLGLVFGRVLESVIFLISFSFVRSYAGGYHAKSPISCYIISSLIVVLVLACIRFTPIKYVFVLIILMLLISIPTLLKLAPVETENKPFDEVEKKHFRKKMIINLTVECVLIIILSIFHLYFITYTASLGIMLSACLVLTQKYFKI